MKLDIIDLLEKSNVEFNGKLITTDVNDYVTKLIAKATIHTIFKDNKLLAFIAYYDNDLKNGIAYLSMIVVRPEYYGKGYGKKLLLNALSRLKEKKFKYFELEVLKSNKVAIQFYKNYNFQIINSIGSTKYYMKKEL